MILQSVKHWDCVACPQGKNKGLKGRAVRHTLSSRWTDVCTFINAVYRLIRPSASCDYFRILGFPSHHVPYPVALSSDWSMAKKRLSKSHRVSSMYLSRMLQPRVVTRVSCSNVIIAKKWKRQKRFFGRGWRRENSLCERNNKKHWWRVLVVSSDCISVYILQCART